MSRVYLPDYRIEKTSSILSQTYDWGLKQLNVPTTWSSTEGEGETCLVIDTGMPDHTDIKPNLIENLCVNFTNEDIFDKQSHSTFCTSVIAAVNDDNGVVGYAPKSKIITAKVLESDGSGDTEWVNKALEYAIDIKDKISVISMSLGGNENDERMHFLIKELYKNNIPVVAAAGNSRNRNTPADANIICYPARFSECISVAAYDKYGKIANFSAIGGENFISFPGVNIYGCGLDQKYIHCSGTSMSTPACAGIICLLLAKHKKQERETGLNDCKTVDQIKEHFVKHSIDKGLPGRDSEWGYGLINVPELFDIETVKPVPDEDNGFWNKILKALKKLVEKEVKKKKT